MSITITGGFTMAGGGFTIVPPPSQATAGWFGGGNWAITTANTERIIYATDTATASMRGSLLTAVYFLAATGTLSYGWFAGGQTGSLRISSIQRITYATDTATASNRGPLNFGRQSSAASTDSTTYGWFGGGAAQGSSSYITNVERITYATDTDITSTRGPLTSGRYNLAATGTSSYGWFGGGALPGPPYNSSIVDRITYATDTATASVRGTLGNERYSLAAAGDNTTYGWYGGGREAPDQRSNIRRITYATDTAVAVNRGPLSSAKYKLSAAGNSDYGWFGGGTSPPQLSRIDRITYATDTTTASVRGPLNYEIDSLAATSGLQ